MLITAMIVSDTLNQNFIPIIHEISQLYSIYVLCDDMVTHEAWKNEWAKVKGIFTQIESICKIFEQDTKQYEHDLLSISIVPPGDYSQRNLNELSPLFMYSKMLKKSLSAQPIGAKMWNSHNFYQLEQNLV